MKSKKAGREIPPAGRAIPEYWARFEQFYNQEKPDWKGLEGLFEMFSLFVFHDHDIHRSAAGPGPIIQLLKYLRRYRALRTFHIQGSFLPASIQDTKWLAEMPIGPGPKARFDLRTGCHADRVKIAIGGRTRGFTMVGDFAHHQECWRTPFSVFFIR
jgi:hypothetical protein